MRAADPPRHEVQGMPTLKPYRNRAKSSSALCFNTQAVHGAGKIHDKLGAVTMPIYQVSHLAKRTPFMLHLFPQRRDANTSKSPVMSEFSF